MSYWTDLQNPTKRAAIKALHESMGAELGKYGAWGLGLGAAAAGIGLGSRMLNLNFATYDKSDLNAKVQATVMPRAIVGGAILGAIAFRKPLGNVVKRLLGGPDMLTGIGMTAKRAVSAGAEMIKDVERYAVRPLLTGRGPHSTFQQAYFPFLHNVGEEGLNRIALNPTIGRRVLMGGTVVGGLTALGSLRQQAPAPSVYYDGVQMRHQNDHGANAQYAQSILGNHTQPLMR